MTPPSAFPPGDRAMMEDLKRRIADLERMKMSGIGISNTGGASGWVAPQVGFPAIITSTFSQDTGYDWERLVLNNGVTPPVVEAYDGPLTGQNAVALDNDETIPVDSRVWLEPDPNGAGWLLTSVLPSADENAASPCGVGCGWTAGLTTEDCLMLTITAAYDACSALDLTQEFCLEWSVDSWLSGVAFVYPGGSGTVEFWVAEGQPHLSINNIELVLNCCGDGYAIFAGGEGLGLCNGTHVPCGDNVFYVKVECVICGAEGTPCDDTGTVTLACCPSDPVPETLFASLSGGYGTIELTFNSLTNEFTGEKTLSCGEKLYIKFSSTLCAASFSCTGTGPSFIPCGAAGTETCGSFVSKTFTANMENTFAGCAAGSCLSVDFTISP
jgi:hypothetical protein